MRQMLSDLSNSAKKVHSDIEAVSAVIKRQPPDPALLLRSLRLSDYPQLKRQLQALGFAVVEERRSARWFSKAYMR
ncbi:MAG: hypothetical protein ACLSFJ_15230 [Holdemania filiformis]